MARSDRIGIGPGHFIMGRRRNNVAFAPTGSTLFNMALGHRQDGGWQLGKMANLIGDSSSGKTVIALSTFAECALIPEFDNYHFIYDDVEAACEFNLNYLFGVSCASRIVEGQKNIGGWVKDEKGKWAWDDESTSNTIQCFDKNIDAMLNSGEPFIYVLDSFDALSSKEEMDLDDDHGSYKMEKAKKIGETLRKAVRRLKSSRSVLIIISQTRDNINPASFSKRTRSGGRALKFYATHEVWTSDLGKIKRRDRAIGMTCRAKITKNKVTGLIREVDMPIYSSYGIDDIQSCIDWLVQEKIWVKKKQSIDAYHFDQLCSKAKLIEYIEDEGEEPALRRLVQESWLEIEEDLKPNRKRKYE